MRNLVLLGLVFTVGCSGPESSFGVAEESLTTNDAVNRAEEWVTNQLQYCQAAYGQTDYDQACWSMPWEKNDRCYRNSNSAWNAYRSDCSGLVSWAWGLASPGRTTYGFYPYMSDITGPIQGTALRAGDAINNSDHVMLFKEWVTAGKRAVFIEEPGCSTTVKHAHEVTVDVTINGTTVTPAGYGMSFTAIRYNKLTVGPAAPPDPCAGLVDGSYCGGDGIGGTKGTLYVCKGGNVDKSTVCKAGCKYNPPGTPDACNAEPATDGGTADGGSEPAPGSNDQPGSIGGPASAGGDPTAAPPQGGCSAAGGGTGGAMGLLFLFGLIGALRRRKLLLVRR